MYSRNQKFLYIFYKIKIGSRDFREQKLDVQLITKFLPALMSLMVDDQVRHLHSKLPPDERETAITVIEHSGPLPETCEHFVKESPVASLLIMYYTLHVIRQKDRIGILRIVPILSSCTDLHSFEDPYLHSLVILLIALQDEFATEDFCTAIFDEFFFVCINHNNVIKHMLKLLWYVVQSSLTFLRVETANLVYFSAYIIRRLYKVVGVITEC